MKSRKVYLAWWCRFFYGSLYLHLFDVNRSVLSRIFFILSMSINMDMALSRTIPVKVSGHTMLHISFTALPPVCVKPITRRVLMGYMYFLGVQNSARGAFPTTKTGEIAYISCVWMWWHIACTLPGWGFFGESLLLWLSKDRRSRHFSRLYNTG